MGQDDQEPASLRAAALPPRCRSSCSLCPVVAPKYVSPGKSRRPGAWEDGITLATVAIHVYEGIWYGESHEAAGGDRQHIRVSSAGGFYGEDPPIRATCRYRYARFPERFIVTRDS